MQSDDEPKRSAYEWIGRTVVYAAAVIGGFVFATDVVEPAAEHHPLGVAALIAVGGVCLAGGVWLARRRAEQPALGWIPPVVIFLGLVAFAGWVPGDDEHRGDISYYCEYGAVSRAQLAHCESHVSGDYIDSLDTNAARFSRGDLDACLQDSGPYCDATSYHNDVEFDAP